MIKKLTCFAAFLILASTLFTSCKKSETYAELKKKEKAAIESYISDNKIKVITEEQFFAQDSTTNVSNNEYVLFESSGIYLQIIRKGGSNQGTKRNNHFAPLGKGETKTILCRFTERSLYDVGTIQLSNDNQYYSSIPEKMIVTNTSGTFSGSFVTTSSLMYTAYSSQAVPSGWLTPLTYLNLGRPVTDDELVAKIKVIVPSAQGQYNASSEVYPCIYDLTYELGI